MIKLLNNLNMCKLTDIINEEIIKFDKSIKPKFIIPVGISGSGKSTWINSLKSKNVNVISPDEIRRELTGDISNQSKNKDIFDVAFQRAIDSLNNNISVILMQRILHRIIERKCYYF